MYDHMIGAEYTVTLGELARSGFDLGLRDYPIYDEKHRDELNTRILEHFWTREIGFETPALFRQKLNTRLAEIMPVYNQFYRAEAENAPTLDNYDMTTESESSSESSTRSTAKTDDKGTTSATAESDTDTDSKGRNVVSVTPQTQLSGHEDYATNLNDTISNTNVAGKSANKSESTGTSEQTATGGASDESRAKSRAHGRSGVSYAQAIADYRTSVLNVDMLVIAELEPLFMGVYTVNINLL